ncbi:MAG: DUF692 domain-containing protein [Gammaproteobacteria bacterium]|nr:DUF692 domain-containing protein [Gammaproteobacteria bacterium]MBL6998747.1 DUF692 domain-containing protein [Gammaproteobacteria bacterium]
MSTQQDKPFLGFGLGLRTDHYQEIIEQQPKEIDWFEIISENYMVEGGKPLYFLDKIRQDYPMLMHGVSMSIGSTDPLNMDYLGKLKALIERVEPMWISDHLCWTGVDHKNMHDLLPLPYTEASVDHIAGRITQVQDFLGRQMLIENLSSYITYTSDAMSEWEFLTAVAEKADCYILLDINNIYVSSFNHHFDPMDYLQGIPAQRVWQHHLAGHQNNGNLIIDTHDHPIIDPVWELYARAAELLGPVSTMIERDANIPPLAEVIAELNQARAIAAPFYRSQQHD